MTMKKLGLLLAGGIAAIVLLHTIGPIIGLLIGIVLFYIVLKQFLKANTTGAKIGFGAIGFIVLISVIQHVPALIGVVAAYVLYLIYKKWSEKDNTITSDNADPFVNFEKQWKEMTR
jgi:lia operon protein LiaI